jgi:hypothetical protein
MAETDAIVIESELHTPAELQAAIARAATAAAGATLSLDAAQSGASAFRTIEPGVAAASITGGAAVVAALIEALGKNGRRSDAAIVRVEAVSGELIEFSTSATPDVVRDKIAEAGDVQRISFLDM